MYYYPTNEPCVVKDGAIQVRRELPFDGEIGVEVGQRVEADQVVAVGRGSTAVTIIDAATELGVSPADVIRGMTQEIGAKVRAGELLVSIRSGLRKRELKAREEGIVVGVEPTSGQIRFQPTDGTIELKAAVAGVVDVIEGRQVVVITTTATHLFGIWGVGQETHGVLRVMAANQDLQADMIDARVSLAVVVGGRSTTLDALKKAVTVGVKAVILGSVNESIIRQFVEAQVRVAPHWYIGGPNWQLPASLPRLPLTIVITEGFGTIPMNQDLLTTLVECEGREVSLASTTAMRGQRRRPEIIIPAPNRAEVRPPQRSSLLPVGSRVRLVEPQALGMAATVLQSPALRPFSDGLLWETVQVETDEGERRIVPLANLELII